MNRSRWKSAIACIAWLTFPLSAARAANNPMILLHVVAANKVCGQAQLANCTAAISQGSLNTPYHVFVVVAPSDSMLQSGAGIAGLQFGLDYSGGFDPSGNPVLPIDIFSWTLCATLEFITPTPQWPGPGGGNLITWDSVTNCQLGNLAVAGYFYLTAYSPATLRLTPRPVDQRAKVATCGAVELDTWNYYGLGIAAFSAGSTVPGCNPCIYPCGIDPVESTTWSRIKSQVGQ
ncbi:MAG TPA: hypothetical protein VF720_05890 [Candidatus Eisenbacteria bacterium]